MYQLKINNLTHTEFLSQHWQKKPLLIKNGFSDFEDPITAEELAGLAMEESIESRIITNSNNQWDAHHGPFEDFSLLKPTHSTLLVQAVDHWHLESAQLLEAFRFIPNWRIDDLMVSFSSPKGGVGAHLDQYDVFIIQGKGKRHWRVGMPQPHLKEVLPCKSLLQIEAFKAVIDVVLEPGDILYIPPNCPHEGYAIEDAINYSVGFRAPNQIDMLSSFADHLIDNDLGKIRYSDANLQLRTSIGEIQHNESKTIKNLLIDALNDEKTFKHWLGRSMSEAKHELDIEPLEDLLSNEEVIELIKSPDISFNRIGGLRSLYQIIDDKIIFSTQGDNYILPLEMLASVQLLTDNTALRSDQLKSSINFSLFIEILTKIINEGYWYTD
ncbi:cupin domain-containing protein [Pseudoalteromonas denitrificans]|uniref:50S ribosomal protein L16 3-hydroxylase n=1 Tax=Pseudoalteromonas denitrificans DSM 6059 TaxID=1123010 RepID=A0A1I1P8Z8_9GAMM|nr:cupin domain-containing protein [Pseudoalteromonas denitrificans]SFD06166.1 50S ribosomal protein L16 3-hydroxylase [Pseudoalteromonas denitrificans DSM 6059]